MAYISLSFAIKYLKSRKVLVLGHLQSQYLRILPENASYLFDHILEVDQKKDDFDHKSTFAMNNDHAQSDKLVAKISNMQINVPDCIIGGYHNEQKMLEESVEWCLINPSKLNKLGIKPSKGILLFGPPGCGKTLLVKNLAQRVKASFYAVRIPDIVKSYVGESEKAIMNIFQKAKQLSPCILFLDEIDAIVSKGDSDFNAKVCYQFCAEMDALDLSRQRILVIAATNHKEIIDPLIMSPSRLGRMIHIGLPKDADRKDIVELMLPNLKMENDEDEISNLVALTEGMTGAHIQEFLRKKLMKHNLFLNDHTKELQ